MLELVNKSLVTQTSSSGKGCDLGRVDTHTELIFHCLLFIEKEFVYLVLNRSLELENLYFLLYCDSKAKHPSFPSLFVLTSLVEDKQTLKCWGIR